MTELFSLPILVFEQSWNAALLIIALFCILGIIGKRLHPAWRFGIWLLIVIPLFIHISMPSSWSIFNLIPSGQKFLNVMILPTVLGISLQILLAVVWSLGCVLMTVIFGRQVLACRQWIKLALPVKNKRALTVFEKCRRRMNVKSRLCVMESPSVSGPFLIGTFHPILLLPFGMARTASDNQLRTVFLHELAHLKRWDVWSSWVMSVLLVVHWFNPFLWAAIRRMNADREEACDAMALETLNQNERLAYGHALIDIAEHFLSPRKTPGLVGISETKELMTGRIEMIQKVGTWKWYWKMLATVLALFIALVTMTDAADVVKTQCTKSLCVPCDPLRCVNH
ncbi:MAG: M56 family metallopeptidase [Planctomycetaceae bacterium]|jgi:bla regulator protein BlaR1|nr:M56 family metallopeptidase [Planctomycetaceae bacterium]